MPPARRACRKTPSRRRPGWRQAASRPLPREHPEERHLTLRLLHPHELVEDQLESRVANELTVRRGVEGREEHVDTEPLIGPIGAPTWLNEARNSPSGFNQRAIRANRQACSSRGTCMIE